MPHIQERGCPDIDDRVAELHRVDPSAAIGLWIFLLEAPCDEIELSARVYHTRVRGKTSNDLEIMNVANGCRLRVEPERCPNLRAEGIVEAFFSHAHDVVMLAVQEHRLAHDVRVVAETLRPGGMAQHGGAGADIFGVERERASELWLHAERLEKAGCHQRALKSLRVIPSGQIHVPPLEGDELVEMLALRFPVEKIRRSDAAPLPFGVGRQVVELDEAVEVWNRERAEDEGVDEGKNSRVRSDPERERHDDDARERRVSGLA